MSRPDFSRIWGSDNAPFTPIEASDYAAGWVFRTGAPPRRVNFDYFQNLSDQRAAWLGEQMLLAVGHEWQDDVSYDAYAVVRSHVNGRLYRSLMGSNLGNEPSVSGSQWALGVADTAEKFNAPIATIASAATVNLTTGAPDTSQITISGSVAITGFTVAAGRTFIVKFTGAPLLTNNAVIVTGRGVNIQTAAGDSVIIRSTAANVVEILPIDLLSDAATGTRGQTWQVLTGSRVAGTTYTNTTGRAIVVSINNNSGATSTLSIAGVVVARASQETGGQGYQLTGIVPAGSTYVYAVGAGLFNWTELR